MPASKKRCEYVSELVQKIGMNRAVDKLKLPDRTVRRYLRRHNQLSKDGKAKVLLFDIETAPAEVFVWSFGEQRIHIAQEIQDWNVICWCGKWLFDDKLLGAVQTPQEARDRDDKRIVQKLWEAIDEADILIGHNLIGFDRKKANTKFLLHGLKPTSPYQTIDTLKVARREFAFLSNKLDYLCKRLGLDTKLETGFELWKDCLKGNRKALEHMFEYCGQDVAILEDLYLKLRPWVKSHPNIGLYMSGTGSNCPNCGSEKVEYHSKPYYTPTGQYQSFRCQDCGAFSRSRFAEKRPRELLRSVAR